MPLSIAHSETIKLKNPNLISVVSYSEFKPISYGNGQGYESDLLRAIAQLWKVNITFHPESIYQGIWRLPSRSYIPVDIAMGGITPQDYRRKEGASFSIMTTHFSQSLLVRKKDYESGRITSYHSFKNSALKIGVVPGTTGEKYAYVRAQENDLPASVIVQLPSESALLPALKTGKIDAIARGEIGNDYQAAHDNSLITISRKSFNEGFSFAIDKSNPELKVKINDAIRLITNNGKITYKQWTKNHHIFSDQVRKLRISH